MILLVLFSFLAGVITILSPCILPILPIVLSGSIGEGKMKPLGIICGFILSFTFFTLFLSTIVTITNLSADALRNISVVVVMFFGISLLVPQFQVWTEQMFSKVSHFTPKGRNAGFLGGIVIGSCLGLVWTPCVGPILASVITLAATNTVTIGTTIVTLSYATGTALPMLAVMYMGRGMFAKIPWLLPNSANIQKGFGIVMILVAFAIYFNVDRSFQAFILETFPRYTDIITQLENNKFIEENLMFIK